MKRFAFPLQAVLEVKRRREEALLEELAKRTRAAAAAQDRLRELRAERRRAQGELRRLLQGWVEVEKVRSARGYVAAVDSRIEAQSREVQRRNEEVKACRQQVVAAAQERKTMEKLRERHWDAYRAEYYRQEQGLLDEVATQGYARRER
jgi:flagellar FliJ protein